MADRYFVSGGTGNWNSTTNWSDSDGGSSGSSVPGSSDDVFLTATSGANTLTVNVASEAKSITCTGFTGTLTLGANLTVSGDLTLVSGMTFTPSTYEVKCNATASITSSGKSFSKFQFDTSGATFTLEDDMTVTSDLTFADAWSGGYTINGNTIHAKGDIKRSTSTAGSVAGTTTISIDGSGTQTVQFYAYSIATNYSLGFSTPIVIASSGTVVFDTTAPHKIGGNLTYTSGTVTTTSSKIILMGNGVTQVIDTGTVIWNNFRFEYPKTVTLSSDLIVAGTLDFGDCWTTLTLNGNNIKARGNITRDSAFTGSTYGSITGTTTLLIEGDQPQTYSVLGYSNNTTGMKLNVTINKTGDTLTFSGVNHYSTGTLTYTAGTVDAGTSTLNITGSCTLNVADIDWYNITWAAAGTTTLSSALTATNLMTIGASTTFSGLYDITTVGLTFSAASTTTLVDDFIVTGTTTWGISTVYNLTLNGGTLHMRGDVTWGTNYNRIINGTTTLLVDGAATQNWTGVPAATGTSLQIKNPFQINKTGNTITFLNVNWFGGNFIQTSAADTVSFGTSTFRLGATLSTQSVTLLTSVYDLTLVPVTAGTYTVNSDITVTHTTNFGGSNVANLTLNGNNLYMQGDVNFSTYNRTIDGTTTLQCTGSSAQTWTVTGNASYNVFLKNNVTINKTGNTVTMATLGGKALQYSTGTWTQTSGASTIDWETNSILFQTIANCNLNHGAAVLYDLQVSTAGTATLTGNATVSHTCTVDASRTLALGSNTLTLQGDLVNNGTFNGGTGEVIFDGTTTISGSTATTTFYDVTLNSGKTLHLTSEKTYVISNSFESISVVGATTTIDATTPDTQAVLTVDAGTIDIERVIVTDIDSSAGSLIYNYKGTLDNATNWSTTAEPVTRAYTWAC